MDKELLANVLQVKAQLKILHWQTESYAEHKAFGHAYNDLEDKIDRLMEVYAGKYQRPKFGGVKQITLADYSNLKIDSFLEAFEDFIKNAFMASQDTEIANIRDEIVADIEKLKYRLTLK